MEKAMDIAEIARESAEDIRFLISLANMYDLGGSKKFSLLFEKNLARLDALAKGD